MLVSILKTMYKTVGKMLPKVAKTGKEYFFISLENGKGYRALNAYKHDDKEEWTIKENK